MARCRSPRNCVPPRHVKKGTKQKWCEGKYKQYVQPSRNPCRTWSLRHKPQRDTSKVFGLRIWGWIQSTSRLLTASTFCVKFPMCKNTTRSWHATELRSARVAQSHTRCCRPRAVKTEKIPVDCRILKARALQTQLMKTYYLSSTTHTFHLLFQP